MKNLPSTISDFPRERGVAVLPIIIGIAVAIALLQVPMLYKTKAGNTFSGSQKGDISAKSIAEAGIDAIIADIGRKAITVTLSTDTTPYHNVTLGRGTFTTHIKGYQTNPDKVEVVSTGRIGNATQSVRAKMEVVKTLTTIPYDTPKISLWGIRGTPPVLYYHSLDERDSGYAWVHPEGQVIASDGSTLKVEDFTVAPNGAMYFINNIGGNSSLYMIRPIDLDNNPASAVTARLVGPTGLITGSPQEIRGLTFIAHDTTGRNGVLYAVTWQSREVFELNLENGAASIVSKIIPKAFDTTTTPFWCDALTQDLAGALFMIVNVNTKSQLWRFDEFVEVPGAMQDSASFICEITPTKAMARAIAGHPNGYLYATDDSHWYRIDPTSMPENKRSTQLFADSSGLKGMGFHFEREDLKFTGKPIKHKINVCHRPPGNCGNAHTIQIDSSALPGHVTHGGSTCLPDTPGYCGPGSPSMVMSDTTIQLRIISWEEFSADQVASP